MDERDKFLEEAGKLLEIMEIEKVRKDKFIDPLVRELEQVAIQYFPKISTYDTDLRDSIRVKAKGLATSKTRDPYLNRRNRENK